MTMLMKDIRRMPLPGVLNVDDGLSDLGTKALEVLGYGGLANAKHEQAEKPLATALARLGVQPLMAADVERYQREQIVEASRRKFEEYVRGQESGAYLTPFYGPAWTETKIENYKQPVPVRVLEQLVRIKEAVPDAVIEIVHLEETPDPFAKVSFGPQYSPTESYWVAVWDEPGFQA